ncbi:DNA cytosine methyltransferase [Rhodococcus sp. 14-2483-1-2]|uniref:DNA cytosine methyltransferase n=1 Tax=Rhodococcus sp. 14-2483-1-2 TaxID=2023147 RepID=UPI00207B6BCB|nr:DNA cytosine methyltransferase [Rhodococcus sp. 14-2483-1-2]
MRTEFFKLEKGRCIHPVSDRLITHREAAGLQSFPDSFEFERTKIQVARQVGNAAPRKLATALALLQAGILNRKSSTRRKAPLPDSGLIE